METKTGAFLHYRSQLYVLQYEIVYLTDKKNPLKTVNLQYLTKIIKGQ